jgi:hypothetical protein
MANPSSVGVDDANMAVLVTAASDGTVTLNPQRTYTVAHDGERNDGSTTDTSTIYLANDAVADRDGSEGANKAKLLFGRELVIGPGITTLHFGTEAGTPTLTIVPGIDLYGDF